MALQVSQAATHVNGNITPSPAEDDELYDQLLRLRDAIVAGKHASLKLPTAVVEQLQASLTVSSAQATSTLQSQTNGALNGIAFATNQEQPLQSSSFHASSGLQASSAPLLNGSAQTYGAKPSSAAGLDPIFLEKSDSLVRAEGQLKRQRLDRDIQTQVDQRKHASRGQESGLDAPSPIDVDDVLLNALKCVKPTSGLKAVAGSAASSSFDENDYYSSQVQSDWSSEASSSKASDGAAGAFTADFERLDGAPQASSSRVKHAGQMNDIAAVASSRGQHIRTIEDDDTYEPEEIEDEYTPPDATAIDSSRANGTMPRHIPQVATLDEDSDYEPGEITHESNALPSNYQTQQPAHTAPHFPVIRNHLTHIAAPQPNRVSPLATAKGPSYELELVNGRPEVVQKPQPRPDYVHSRVSTASPSGNGVSGSGKKRRNKKRKRDHEPTGRAKRRRERQGVNEVQTSVAAHDPYIKNEPLSPPAFAHVPEVPPYGQVYTQQRPAQIDLVSPLPPPQPQSTIAPPRSGLRYEYAQPAQPTVVRMASPSTHRPAQRDTQDLRRVASLHYAQRPASPQQRMYSPVGPYRTASMTYGDPRLAQPAPPEEDTNVAMYKERPAQEPVYYTPTERSRSPPRLQEYRAPYAERAASPALMPPPVAAPPRRIIVDQYGNRYYAAAPASAAAPTTRASVAPVELHPPHEMAYERAPSRASVAYAPAAPHTAQYESADDRMLPPPPSRRKPAEQRVEYVDANGYPLHEYNARQPEPVRYTEAPTSPVYQPPRGYDQMQMPPPPLPATEPTPPVYVPRSYSVRPEEPQQAPFNYVRQASLAPVQYVRQEGPPPPQARAVSVMPAPPPPQRMYSQAPQAVRYVDQYGQEVFPRQVSEMMYQ